jgi:hypothetical protein
MSLKVLAFLALILCFYNTHAQNTTAVIRTIVLHGNTKTKDKILYREIQFAIGDTVSSEFLKEKILQSQRNIINTGLFNFATIIPMYITPEEILIEVTVEERWFIWPSPIFELAETNFNTWWLTRDFRRTNYGAFINWKNFRGRNDNLYLKLRFGYNQEFRLSYRFPYFDKKQNFSAGISFDYFQQKEIAIGTIANKREFISLVDNNMRQEHQYKLQGFYRKNIFTEHLAELRYSKTQIHDTVVKVNENYLLNGSKKADYFSLIYRLKIDHRDIKAYPLKGYEIEAFIQKNGLALGQNSFGKFTFMKLGYKAYQKLSERWFTGFSLKQKLSWFNKEPYYFQQGLGYSDFVRGYEFYVIDGQQYSLVKTNLKFRIVKPRVKTFSFVQIKQFSKVPYTIFANVFFDTAYTYDKLYFSNNSLANKWLTGMGIGIDFVTYYDKVIRVEFSRNHLNETGLFFHFTQPL